ncbi:MAG: type II toxin-antitoxin system prevent-host-death family antitoxin [Verrucomicrobia bacterium]|nr:type II toxin-antitoxin system prevent-host-death family antitoxin [Verrucomicrobiota bacterium]
MVVTLKESKARLSELVARAEGGEEIVITVRGKAKARLSAAQSVAAGRFDRAKWLADLAGLRARGRTGRRGPTSDEVLDRIRS